MSNLVEAGRQLVSIERQFGFARDVEFGLYALRVFAPRELTAAWALELLGLRTAAQEALTFSPCTLSRLRSKLLPDECFGLRSEEDSAWFDPTPEGTEGIAQRDRALEAFFRELGEPVEGAVLMDSERPENSRGAYEVILLRSPRAVVVLGRATGQLSTRSDEKYFSANAAAFLD